MQGVCDYNFRWIHFAVQRGSSDLHSAYGVDIHVLTDVYLFGHHVLYLQYFNNQPPYLKSPARHSRLVMCDLVHPEGLLMKKTPVRRHHC